MVKRILLLAAVIGVAMGCRHTQSNTVSRDPKANVLFLTMDTTRADHIGAYGYKQIETPNLDALARDGVRFSQAISSIPLTLPAHSSLMTGTTPLHHKVRDNGGFFLGIEQTTLAEMLTPAGMKTAAVVGAFVLNHHWGLDQGFQTYDDEFGPSDPRAAADLHEQRDGAEVAEHGIRWIHAHHDEHFFLWLHFYDPHYPYDPKGEFAARYPGRPYDGEIAYTDSLIGRVVDDLKAQGLYDRTLIVVAGDHGEGLGQHGEPDHGIYLYDSTLHVPLIVRAPASAYRRVVDAMVRDIDVAPTILDYLGIAAPASMMGRSLLPLMAGTDVKEERLAYSESFYVRYHYGWKEPVSLRTGRYKLIDLPQPELYDLRNDPGETRNMQDVQPEVLAEMKGELARMRREGGADAAVPTPQTLDPQTAARLQSLGYLGTPTTVPEGDLPDPKTKAEVLDVLVRASRETGAATKSGRLQEAVDTVERAVALEPNFMDGQLFLGTLYLRLGQPDRGIQALQKILKLNPDNIQARQILAKCYIAKKDLVTALGLLDQVIVTSPRYVAAYFAASDLLVEMSRFDAASERMRQLLAMNPDTYLAQYEIGKILLQKGKIEEAHAAIQKALDMDPKVRSAHFNLALIAEGQGNAAEAKREYETELALFPDNFEALTNLGILNMEAGDIARGVETFRRLVAEQPDSPMSYYLLAKAYVTQGRTDDEVEQLAERAVKIDPTFERGRRLVDEIRARRGRG